MDLTRIIEQLYAESHRVRQAIATLEKFQQQRNIAVPAHRTRGRKSMGSEERKVVAERMKTYWAKKRQLTRGTSEGPEQPPTTAAGAALRVPRPKLVCAVSGIERPAS